MGLLSHKYFLIFLLLDLYPLWMSPFRMYKYWNIYGKVSPFEFKDKLLQLAYLNNNKILDAGRGNPNWTAATPRQAFFTFGQFAVLETQRSLNSKGLTFP